ncbi:translation initiation factor IF-2-like isoform X3 [Phyllostomus hastatus]|uniref:translation initiation factor IF-2-like isoform X3 n=1 Tax=Phyllostomus hastatus TaxID=9423 RepID=UPI001E67EB31|nr:translation initiation factor IF-2-like isoform X3 [Phyllostomus hastatus]
MIIVDLSWGGIFFHTSLLEKSDCLLLPASLVLLCLAALDGRQPRLRPRSPRAGPSRSGLDGRGLQAEAQAGKAAGGGRRARGASGSWRHGCARLLPGPFPFSSPLTPAQARPATPSPPSFFPASLSPSLAPVGAGPQAPPPPPPHRQAAGLNPRPRPDGGRRATSFPSSGLSQEITNEFLQNEDFHGHSSCLYSELLFIDAFLSDCGSVKVPFHCQYAERISGTLS